MTGRLLRQHWLNESKRWFQMSRDSNYKGHMELYERWSWENLFAYVMWDWYSWDSKS